MLDRRNFLMMTVAAAIVAVSERARGEGSPRLLLVHGRDQQGKDPAALKALWMQALDRGANRIGSTLPDTVRVDFPFYGDTLDDFTRQLKIPLTDDIRTKGSPVNDDFLRFQAEIAEEMRKKAGVTDAQVDAEYGPNPRPKGPENWEWVQAILRALDKHGGGLSRATLEVFMRDVFLYTTRITVRDAINQIVSREITDQPTIVVAHSLGSVVAYDVLRTDQQALRVPLFVTLGCPLAVRAIRNEFIPLGHPRPVGNWYNAFDERDVVALYPLDDENFPIQPAVENKQNVKNHTGNHHGIVGYLDDPAVAEHILKAVSA